MTVEKETLLTVEGLTELEMELEELKTKKRKEIAEKIKVARSFGDISENSEYDEAKNEQAIVEERIASLQNMLKNVRVLEEDDISTDFVTIGSKVKILDTEFDEEVWYQVVASSEISLEKGKISDVSPIGKALLNHKVNELVYAEAPGGQIEFRILEITK